MNKAAFFERLRGSLYKDRLPQQAVDGLEFLLDHSKEYELEIPQLAYILATVYHETGRKMQPVREGFATTNAGAIKAVTALYNRGGIKTNYALPDFKTGKSYYGRGYEQLTWKVNYEKTGKELGFDLVNNPDLMLEKHVAAKSLFTGMLTGRYTGKRLTHYIKGEMKDYYNARRIINGTDKAKSIAGYAAAFEKALFVASDSDSKERVIPTGKKSIQSTTNIAAGAAVALPTIQLINEGNKAAQDALQAGRGFADILQAIVAQPVLWVFIGVAIAAWWIIKERNKKAYEDGV
jgi:hypothetical protein